MIVTVKDFIEALRKIKELPNDHGLSSEDYKMVIEWEKELKPLTSIFSASLISFTATFAKLFIKQELFVSNFEKKFASIQFVANHDWLISFNLFDKTSLEEVFQILNKKDKETFEAFVLDTFPKVKQRIFSKNGYTHL